MKTELTKTAKDACSVRRFFHKEEGAETIQAVMLVAIGAVVACAIFGGYKLVKSWTGDQVNTMTSESANADEWGKKYLPAVIR